MKWKVFWIKPVCVNFMCDAHHLPNLFSVPAGAPDHPHCISASSHPGFFLKLFHPRKQSTTGDRIVHPWIHSSQTDSHYPGQSFKTSLVPLPGLTCPCAMLMDTQLTQLSSCHKTPCCWFVAQSSQYLGHFKLENEWKIMIVLCILWSPWVQRSFRLSCVSCEGDGSHIERVPAGTVQTCISRISPPCCCWSGLCPHMHCRRRSHSHHALPKGISGLVLVGWQQRWNHLQYRVSLGFLGDFSPPGSNKPLESENPPAMSIQGFVCYSLSGHNKQ